jgi:hypothetical protein
MKPQRTFYTTTGALFLLMMLVGFHRFVTAGRGVGGRIIDPHILPLVTIHGAAIALWFVLFFVQALLIAVKKRPVHMTLGWSAIAIGLAIAITGPWVAIRSVQHTPPMFRFFGIPYAEFLLVMTFEIAAFAIFLTAGILTRKRPKIHRGMMLLASLCLLAGSTARMPFLAPIFTDNGWLGLFGPVFVIGGLILLIRSMMDRTLDRIFAISYLAWVTAFILVCRLCETSAWDRIAASILKS